MNYIGETLSIRLEWCDSTGVLTTPTSTTLTVKGPSGAPTTPTVVPISAGIQTAVFVPSEAGIYQYRAVATGAGATVVVIQDRFYVEMSNV